MVFDFGDETEARMAGALSRSAIKHVEISPFFRWTGCFVSVKARLGGPEFITEIILPGAPQKEEHRKKILRGRFFK
ncbi:MAG: hypothetical protein PHO30_00705 [Candidatus Omnitrophica bacterium]|nr:hypothetical protein [Candidatus Omnitrophota bacterium]